MALATVDTRQKSTLATSSKNTKIKSVKANSGSRTLRDTTVSPYELLSERIASVDRKIDSVKSELNTNIDSVKNELSAQINAVEKNLNIRIDGVDKKVDSIKNELSEQIKGTHSKLNLVLIFMCVGFSGLCAFML